MTHDLPVAFPVKPFPTTDTHLLVLVYVLAEVLHNLAAEALPKYRFSL